MEQSETRLDDSLEYCNSCYEILLPHEVESGGTCDKCAEEEAEFLREFNSEQ